MNLAQVSARPVRRPAASAIGLVLALLATPALAGCAPDAAETPGGGESRLGPRFQVAHPSGRARAAQAQQRRDAVRDAVGRPGKAPTVPPSPGPEPAPAPATPAGSPSVPTSPHSTAAPTPAGPLRAALGDPRGDVRGGLGAAPAHVDLRGASVTRAEGGFEVRVDVAGTFPARQQGSQVQNVAAFFDLDGDALVDYETWGTLSDSGWSGSYRTPDSARFGSSSGVGVRPEGATLVLTFPLSHLEGARAFRWQVGSEWGSFEQVASGTTASDRAGDGGVSFPS